MSNDRMFYFFLFFFFMSGFATLVYESVWARDFSLILGSTARAEAIVVSIFMGGLFTGTCFSSFIITYLKNNRYNFFKLYSCLELTASSLVILYVQLREKILSISHIETIHSGSRFFLLAPVFLITLLLGGTYPFLVEGLSSAGLSRSRSVSIAYSINALGASIGLMAYIFFMAWTFGLKKSLLLSSGTIFILSVPGLLLSKKYPGRTTPEINISPSRSTSQNFPALSFISFPVIASFILGFCALSVEMLLFRQVGAIAGSSIYSFGLVLFWVILGIACGSFLSTFSAKAKEDFSLASSLLVILVLLLPFIFLAGPFSYVFFMQKASSSYLDVITFLFLFTMLAVFPFYLVSGYSFPLLARIIPIKEDGKAAGLINAANTAGALAGTISTVFFLIPACGVKFTVILVAGLYYLIHLYSRTGHSSKWDSTILPVLSVTLLYLLATVDTSMSSCGAFYRLERYKSAASPGELFYLFSLEEKIYEEEGQLATVTVSRSPGDILELRINGKTEASTTAADMKTQRLLSIIPLLVAPEVEKTLVIGLGSGITAGTLLNSTRVRELTVHEIEPAVSRAARYFEHLVPSLWKDRRVRLEHGDTRQLLLEDRKKYNLIISEPSNPWVKGMASLFTREHFLLLSKRLAEGGVVCQWVQLYSTSTFDFFMIFKTFNSVFPYVSVWRTSHSDVLLAGSFKPPEPGTFLTNYRTDLSGWLKKLNETRRETLFSLLSREIFVSPHEPDWLADYPLNVDDLPLLEHNAPMNMYEHPSRLILSRLERAGRPEKLSVNIIFPAPSPEELLSAAAIMLDDREYEQARSMASEVIMRCPGELEARMVIAKSYIFENKPDLAFIELAKLIELGFKGNEPFILGDRLLGRVDRNDPAVAAALKIFRDGPPPGNFLIQGHLNELNGDISGAITSYLMAISMGLEPLDLHTRLGLLYLKNGERRLALKEFVRAIQISPADIRVYRLLGELTPQFEN